MDTYPICDSPFRGRRGTGLFRYRNIAEITVLMCEEKLYPLWFSCRRKSYPVLCEHFFVLRANNSMFSADGRLGLESKILNHFKGLINSLVKKKENNNKYFFFPAHFCTFLDSQTLKIIKKKQSEINLKDTTNV